MRMLSITLLYAGILSLMLVAISVRVSLMRRKYQVAYGDGGHSELQRASRVQGNFIEYAPLALMLIFLLERTGVPSWEIHLLGMIFLVARIAHAISLYGDIFALRGVGMIGTWGVLVVGGVLALALSFGVIL